MKQDFLNDKRLQHISREKKALLAEFAEQIQGHQNAKELMPIFLSFQKRMREQSLSLSQEESALMLTLLFDSMTPKEKEQWQKLLQRFPKQTK